MAQAQHGPAGKQRQCVHNSKLSDHLGAEKWRLCPSAVQERQNQQHLACETGWVWLRLNTDLQAGRGGVSTAEKSILNDQMLVKGFQPTRLEHT
jgi:hypothetical protein